MSGTSEATRLIELMTARLRRDIDSPSELAPDLPTDEVRATSHGSVSSSPGESRAAAALGQDPPRLPPSRRVKLLHAAWGPDDSALSSDQVLLLAAGLPAGVVIDASGLESDCIFPPGVGRIVLNLLLLAAESLPAGGTIRLAGSADDLFLRIDGPGGAWPAGMAAFVVDKAAAAAALAGDRGLQMPLTVLLAHTAGVRLSFLLSPSSQTAPPILRLGGG